MNNGNKVKVKWNWPDRHVHFTIIANSKYGGFKFLRNRPNHINLTLSNEPWKKGQMKPVIQTCTSYNHAIHQIEADLLLNVSMKLTKTQNLTLSNDKRLRNETCHRYMYILLSFQTLNIVDQLPIVSSMWTWPRKFNLYQLSMKWCQGQMNSVWWTWRPCNDLIYIPNIVILSAYCL